jgi:hypothetical protein
MAGREGREKSALARAPRQGITAHLPIDCSVSALGRPFVAPTARLAIDSYPQQLGQLSEVRRHARLTQREVDKLAACGYVVEPGVPLATVVEAFVSDSLTGVVIRAEV